MSYFFIVVAMTNLILQSHSRNLTFFYVFVASVIGGFILLFAETKTGKIASLSSILLYMILSAISLYYHFLYGCVINDYLIIMVECIILSMLTAISILPIKIAKTSRRKKREVLPYMEQRWTIKQVEFEDLD
jgi:membrane-bound ClpP family serine protease